MGRKVFADQLEGLYATINGKSGPSGKLKRFHPPQKKEAPIVTTKLAMLKMLCIQYKYPNFVEDCYVLNWQIMIKLV